MMETINHIKDVVIVVVNNVAGIIALVWTIVQQIKKADK